MNSKYLKILLFVSLTANLIMSVLLIYRSDSYLSNLEIHPSVMRELKFENQIKFFNQYIELAYNFETDNYVQRQVSALVFLDDYLKQLKVNELEVTQENIFIKNVKQRSRLLKITEIAKHEYLLYIASEIIENKKPIELKWQVKAKTREIQQSLSNPYGIVIQAWDRQLSEDSYSKVLQFIPQKILEIELPCPVLKIENIRLVDQAVIKLQDNNKKLRVIPSVAEPFAVKIFCEDQYFELAFQSHENEHILFYYQPETKSKILALKKSVAKKKAILTRTQIRKMLKDQIGLEVDLEEKIQK